MYFLLDIDGTSIGKMGKYIPMCRWWWVPEKMRSEDKARVSEFRNNDVIDRVVKTMPKHNGWLEGMYANLMKNRVGQILMLAQMQILWPKNGLINFENYEIFWFMKNEVVIDSVVKMKCDHYCHLLMVYV